MENYTKTGQQKVQKCNTNHCICSCTRQSCVKTRTVFFFTFLLSSYNFKNWLQRSIFQYKDFLKLVYMQCLMKMWEIKTNWKLKLTQDNYLNFSGKSPYHTWVLGIYSTRWKDTNLNPVNSQMKLKGQNLKPVSRSNSWVHCVYDDSDLMWYFCC